MRARSDGRRAGSHRHAGPWVALMLLAACTVDAGGQADTSDADAASELDAMAGADAPADAASRATWPPSVSLLELSAQGTAATQGTLAGAAPHEPTWMLAAGHGCLSGASIDGSSAKLFTGGHRIFALSAAQGPYVRIRARVEATGKGDPRVALVTLPAGTRATPASVASSLGCVAASNASYDGSPVEAVWNSEGDAPVEVVVVVAGGAFDKGFGAGDFALTVTVEPLPKLCHDLPYGKGPGDPKGLPGASHWPSFVQPLAIDASTPVVVQGSLDGGLPMCSQDFAWSSQVACYPAPQADLYSGAVRMYALELPKAGQLTLRVTPDPGVDISAFALQMGTSSFYTPPHVPTAICEQSPKKNFDSEGGPGRTETLTIVSTKNPYHVLLVVAGAHGAAKGGFTVEVDAKLAADDSCGALWQQPALTAFPTKATEWSPAVETISLGGKTDVDVPGDLAKGKVLCSQAFAWSSQIACYPATQAVHFAGKQRFYAVEGGLGPGEQVEITVTPDPGVDVSLYGYWTGSNSFQVPPKVAATGACEASHAKTLTGAGNPGVPESIQFQNPGKNAYNLFFAVAGHQDQTTAGTYSVHVRRIPKPPPFCPESLPGESYAAWPQSLGKIALDADGKGSAKGDLATGSCTNLGFAASSQNACFPATQFAAFQGHHVAYVLADPLPPKSVLDLVVTPDAGVDVNIYGYLLGTNSFYLPPKLPSSLSCEAAYANGKPNPGVAESLHVENPTSNAYQVVLVVAGPSGATAGGFSIAATQQVAKPHCPESLPGQSYDAWPSSVKAITVDGSGKAHLDETLAGGGCTNLGFAADANVACFPATQNGGFAGNHRFFALSKPLGPGDTVDVAVTPGDGVDVNLYGYQIGSKSFYVPPMVPTAVPCEASYGKQGANPGDVESIHFENPGANSYNIFFAVAGPKGTGAASYSIDVLHKVAPPPFCPESLPGKPTKGWPANVTLLKPGSDGKASASGDLKDGACTNLAFAASSQNACFPATQNEKFDGNQRFYALDGVLGPLQTLTVRAKPAAGVDVSLYGYLMGTGSWFTPPYVPTVGVCEASPTKGGANPGVEEVITFANPTGNAYHVFFSVAGAAGAKSGGFSVAVEAK